jgi:hypothetical protein
MTINPGLLTEQIEHHRRLAESTIMLSEHRHHTWMARRLECQLSEHEGSHTPVWSRIARSSCPAGCGTWECTCGNVEVRHDTPGCARQAPYA